MSYQIPEYYQISFDYEVAKGVADTYEETINYPTLITSYTMSFPPGCNRLVGVEVFINNHRVIPLQGEPIALDTETLTKPLNLPVLRNARLQVKWSNADDTHAHTIPVIFDCKILSPEEITKIFKLEDGQQSDAIFTEKSQLPLVNRFFTDSDDEK